MATNSLAAASVLSGSPAIELHVFGGLFLNRQSALLSESSIGVLGAWAFDAAFLSAEGMDARGLSNSHETIADFQKAVLRQASQVYFCLDASKLGKTTPYRVSAWKQVTALVTDATPRRLAALGIRLPASRILRA